jgi:tetratricopeptide (TPR) repeat protein
MRTFYTLEQFRAECAKCGTSVDVATVYDAISSGRILAYRPATAVNDTGGVFDEWNGQGGWPADAVVPWVAALAFVAHPPEAEIAQLCRVAVDVGLGRRFRWNPILRWLDLHGTLGLLGDMIPMLAEPVIASMRGAPRLEARLIRLQYAARSTETVSRVSVTDDVSLTLVRAVESDSPVVTLPIARKTQAPAIESVANRLRALRSAGDLGGEVGLLQQLVSERPVEDAGEHVSMVKRLAFLLASQENDKLAAIQLLRTSFAEGFWDDALIADTAILVRDAEGPAALLDFYDSVAESTDEMATAIRWYQAAADLALVEPGLAQHGLDVGHRAVDRFGRTNELSTTLAELSRRVGDTQSELEHAEYALATGASDRSGRIAARIARLLYDQGDLTRSEFYVREALQQDALAAESLRELVGFGQEVAEAVGDAEVAATLWTKWASHPDGEILWEQRLLLAHALMELGRIDEAIEAAEAALSQATLSPVDSSKLSSVHLMLGRLKRSQHRYDSAAWHAVSGADRVQNAPATHTPIMGVRSFSAGYQGDHEPDVDAVIRTGDIDEMEAVATRLRGRSDYEKAASLLEYLAELPAVVADQPRRSRIFASLASVYERLQSPDINQQGTK